MEVLNDDLNTAQALAVLWEGIKSDMAPEEKYELVRFADEVLRLDLLEGPHQEADREIPNEVMTLVQEREALRKEKKWKESDEVRAKIEEKGYTVKDTSEGTEIKKKAE